MTPKTCCIQTWLNPELPFLFLLAWLPWKPNCKGFIAFFVVFGGIFLVWFNSSTKFLCAHLVMMTPKLHFISNMFVGSDLPLHIVWLTGYFVTTRLTPHSENNNIRGDYILCITEEEVSLQSAVDRSQTVVTWSVGQIRGFKSEPAASAGVKDMQLLTLKVGRWKTGL